MSVHMGGMQSGQFDAAYTLEPIVSMMVSQGIARKLESGVIAKYMLGRPDACAVLAGGVMSGKFLQERPQVAERLARAWAKALNTYGGSFILEAVPPDRLQYIVERHLSESLS